MLRTQGLVIPPLTSLGHVVRREPRAPRLADQPGKLAVSGVVQQIEDRVAHRLRRWQREAPGARFGHDIEDTAAIPARHHRHPCHERFGRSEAKPLTLSREDHDVGVGQVAGDFGMVGRHR